FPTSICLNTVRCRDWNKLRKPVVEKMRRDRINSSIEQLKGLLETVFHKQQPNVKLEKADILEMTVTYLRQQTLQSSTLTRSEMDYKDGYSRCFEEVIDFL
uniref:Transcription factor HES-5 n=1 Tax=Xenopus tropicalis TaxID=8364 RepID=A0A803JXP9_XENTR